jgi:hypothetical protein
MISLSIKKLTILERMASVNPVDIVHTLRIRSGVRLNSIAAEKWWFVFGCKDSDVVHKHSTELLPPMLDLPEMAAT